MSKSVVISGIKDNWFLVAIIGALLTAALVGATRKEVAADDGLVLESGEITAAPGGRGPGTSTSRWQTPTRDSQLRADIDNYEHELAVNRSSGDTPANLFRLANLYYSNLRDYDKASLYYEDLLQSFPDYEGLNTVYPNLVVCYERLGNFPLQRNTYKRMLRYYPSDSQDYLWAKMNLGG